jgi:hypothetical protein
MTRPRADVGEAELLQKLSDVARMKVDAEPLSDDALEVDPPPAHDAVLLTIRTRLDDLREPSPLLRRKARLGTLRPVVDEALRTRPVEAMDPVTQRLAVHAPDLRRRASVHAVSDRSQRQKPPALVGILRPPGQRSKLPRRIILSQSDR